MIFVLLIQFYTGGDIFNYKGLSMMKFNTRAACEEVRKEVLVMSTRLDETKCIEVKDEPATKAD